MIYFAEPVYHRSFNVVDVNYNVFIKDRKSGSLCEVRDKRPMRYYFIPELPVLLKAAGLKFVHSEEWLTGKPLGEETWNGVIVAKKILRI